MQNYQQSDYSGFTSYGDFGKEVDIKRPRPSQVDGRDPCHLPGFISHHESNSLMEKLRYEIPWEKDPRWSSDYTLPQQAFFYDDKMMKTKKYQIPVLDDLAKRIEDAYSTNVYYIWCNLFPDGGSHIEWHQDQYGYDNFTLSFGASRRFVMRNKNDQTTVADFYLNDGDLYFFSEEADKYNEHCVPQITEEKRERISILFFTDYPRSREDYVYDRARGEYDYGTNSY